MILFSNYAIYLVLALIFKKYTHTMVLTPHSLGVDLYANFISSCFSFFFTYQALHEKGHILPQ